MPGIAPAEEHELMWRRSISAYFDARPLAAAVSGAALPEIHQFHLGAAILVDAEYPPHRFIRDRRWISLHDEVDHMVLQAYRYGGNLGRNGGKEFVQQPGNVSLVNLARESDGTSTQARALSLVLPRDMLVREVPYLAESCGPIVPDHSTAARIFYDHMIALGNHLPQAQASESSMIVETVLLLLGSLVRHGDIASSAARSASFGVICRFIEDQLGNFDLDMDHVCRRFRCSRTTLYRLFKAEGGLARYIQRRRLVACLNALASPRMAHRPIFDIALDYGFGSPSHFSALFASHFGMTPRQAREAGLAGRTPWHRAPKPVSAPGVDSAEAMWQWATKLRAAA